MGFDEPAEIVGDSSVRAVRAGTGSGTFFSAEYFKGMAGVNMLHVAYKGGGPALASVIAGETAVYFTPRYNGHFGLVRPPLDTTRSGSLRDDVSKVTQQLARELELPRKRQVAVLDEPAEGLLGLPDGAHLEARVGQGRHVQDTVADVAATGPIIMPAMSRRGYSRAFTAAITSETPAQRTINAGCLSNEPFQILRWTTYSGLPGRTTCPRGRTACRDRRTKSPKPT